MRVFGLLSVVALAMTALALNTPIGNQRLNYCHCSNSNSTSCMTVLMGNAADFVYYHKTTHPNDYEGQCRSNGDPCIGNTMSPLDCTLTREGGIETNILLDCSATAPDPDADDVTVEVSFADFTNTQTAPGTLQFRHIYTTYGKFRIAVAQSDQCNERVATIDVVIRPPPALNCFDGVSNEGVPGLVDCEDPVCTGKILEYYDTSEFPGTEDIGECRSGSDECLDGERVSRRPPVYPKPDVCDGRDNDCDTLVDNDPLYWPTWYLEINDTGSGDPNINVTQCVQPEGYVSLALLCEDDGLPCTVGLGECEATGVVVCSPSTQIAVCSVSPGVPTQELCNGLDDNCNGLIDEEYPLLGDGCVSGTGECSVVGIYVCNGGQDGVVCNAVAGTPVPEICDTLDNNCNGLIDEDFDFQNDPANCGSCGNTCGSTCTAGVCDTPPVCGNSVVEFGETCDDGNVGNGDGCDSGCQTEATYVCVGEPSICTVSFCNDTIVDQPNGEQCDDGNNVSGDGCSSTCQFEFDCGNGVVDPGEECDDGNLINSDGCSDVCEVDPGYECVGTLSLCSETGTAWCRDMDKDGYGTITDFVFALTQPFGYVADCTDCNDMTDLVFPGAPEIADGLDNDCNGFTDDNTTAAVVCGDNIIVAPEQCDDGNAVGGDGCDASCQVEVGYDCNGVPSTCLIACSGGCPSGYTCDNGTCYAVACSLRTCGGLTYQCGDCVDNDADAFADVEDSECLSACDNNEATYNTELPMHAGNSCVVECFFDSNETPEDQCIWDFSCDEYEPALENNNCVYNENTVIGANTTCQEARSTQTETCLNTCNPPPGCDCFGCCLFNPGPHYPIYIASEDENGTSTCTAATLYDAELCHPCSQNLVCYTSICAGVECPEGQTCDEMTGNCRSGKLVQIYFDPGTHNIKLPEDALDITLREMVGGGGGGQFFTPDGCSSPTAGGGAAGVHNLRFPRGFGDRYLVIVGAGGVNGEGGENGEDSIFWNVDKNMVVVTADGGGGGMDSDGGLGGVEVYGDGVQISPFKFQGGQGSAGFFYNATNCTFDPSSPAYGAQAPFDLPPRPRIETPGGGASPYGFGASIDGSSAGPGGGGIVFYNGSNGPIIVNQPGGDGYAYLTFWSGCGNGILEPGLGEECEVGGVDCDKYSCKCSIEGVSGDGLGGCRLTRYRDIDTDGYGDPNDFVYAVTAGYVPAAGDCDDSDILVNPGAAEICGNGLDDDCDGTVDGGTEICNGVDDDCDGVVDGHRAVCPFGYICAGALGCIKAAVTTSCNTGAGEFRCYDGSFPGPCYVLESDIDNCGTCGNDCTTKPNVITTGCFDRRCYVLTCDAGYGDCNAYGDDGCETEFATDSKNCGGCGNTCAIDGTCVGGVCFGNGPALRDFTITDVNTTVFTLPNDAENLVLLEMVGGGGGGSATGGTPVSGICYLTSAGGGGAMGLFNISLGSANGHVLELYIGNGGFAGTDGEDSIFTQLNASVTHIANGGVGARSPTLIAGDGAPFNGGDGAINVTNMAGTQQSATVFYGGAGGTGIDQPSTVGPACSNGFGGNGYSAQVPPGYPAVFGGDTFGAPGSAASGGASPYGDGAQPYIFDLQFAGFGGGGYGPDSYNAFVFPGGDGKVRFTYESRCGNTVYQAGFGEECDNVPNCTNLCLCAMGFTADGFGNCI